MASRPSDEAKATDVVSDVVEKTSTRRRSRIPCVVVEKKLSRRTFNKNSCDLLTAITRTKILVAHF